MAAHVARQRKIRRVSKKTPDYLQGCCESVVAPSHTRDMIHPQLDAAGLGVFLRVFRAKFALPPDKVGGEIGSP
jgi:hypothetical protein